MNNYIVLIKNITGRYDSNTAAERKTVGIILALLKPVVSIEYVNIFNKIQTCDIGSKVNTQPTPFFYEIEISDTYAL
jgi:hypothetical protein